MYRYCGTYSYTEVLVSTTELILILRNVIRYRSTRRYYRTYTDAGVPIGTTEQIRDRTYTDAGVPVGTTEQIRSELIQMRDLSDTGVPVCTTELIQRQNLSDTGVPLGTTGHIRYEQILFKCRSTRRYYRTDQIQKYP